MTDVCREKEIPSLKCVCVCVLMCVRAGVCGKNLMMKEMRPVIFEVDS